MSNISGVRLEPGLVACIEKACKKMQMSKSGFIRYCVLERLGALSLLSEKVQEG